MKRAIFVHLMCMRRDFFQPRIFIRKNSTIVVNFFLMFILQFCSSHKHHLRINVTNASGSRERPFLGEAHQLATVECYQRIIFLNSTRKSNIDFVELGAIIAPRCRTSMHNTVYINGREEPMSIKAKVTSP